MPAPFAKNRKRPPGPPRERSPFQNVQRTRVKNLTRTTASGHVYVDYKDTESLKQVVNYATGRIQSRRRSGTTAMEQRMVAQAVKRARFMALIPYVAGQQP